MFDVLQERIGSLQIHGEKLEYADEWYGSTRMREHCSKFLNKYLGYACTPESIILAAGASSIIEMLMSCVSDVDDSFLVLAPHYVNFSKIAKYRNKVNLIPVHLDIDYTLIKDGFGEYIHSLNEAIMHFQPKGGAGRLRGLIFSNPSNPLGLIATQSQLQDIISLCVKHQLHCVVDEVYALSAHGSSQFISAHTVARQLGAEALERTHVVYSFSKDFAAAGLRCGLVHTENINILLVLQQLSRFAPVSTLSQFIIEQLIEDESFLEIYVHTLKKRLSHSSKCLCDGLDRLGFRFVRPQAGLFTFVNVKDCLSLVTRNNDSSTEEDKENLLWKFFLDEFHINLSPGKPTGTREEGWFRICSAQPDDVISELLHRLNQVACRRDERLIEPTLLSQIV
eukprot:CAMPEP_0184370760 /NCGR_PEP_ID=MMETSP1089-20130417/163011_1 /TAXON_ID=38269 ORGANISM="Gloeochaete wittrockiana, Strain SAG46.84" /NCGR_SAMPLE_ID=MMETSP1089 /ASSEMBLY_ACC=CAM_ASM_000445 /LENGTH=394 /DNA_ID=CAMNT_0026713417 /DNA_START=176 /DNA_END=1360 /DNA_ORIENTATION=+